MRIALRCVAIGLDRDSNKDSESEWSPRVFAFLLLQLRHNRLFSLTSSYHNRLRVAAGVTPTKKPGVRISLERSQFYTS
jgi:hypothetical protein